MFFLHFTCLFVKEGGGGRREERAQKQLTSQFTTRSGTLQKVGGGLLSVDLELESIRRAGGGVLHRSQGRVFFLQTYRACFIHLSLCSWRTPQLHGIPSSMRQRTKGLGDNVPRSQDLNTFKTTHTHMGPRPRCALLCGWRTSWRCGIFHSCSLTCPSSNACLALCLRIKCVCVCMRVKLAKQKGQANSWREGRIIICLTKKYEGRKKRLFDQTVKYEKKENCGKKRFLNWFLNFDLFTESKSGCLNTCTVKVSRVSVGKEAVFSIWISSLAWSLYGPGGALYMTGAAM